MSAAQSWDDKCQAIFPLCLSVLCFKSAAGLAISKAIVYDLQADGAPRVCRQYCDWLHTQVNCQVEMRRKDFSLCNLLDLGSTGDNAEQH